MGTPHIKSVNSIIQIMFNLAFCSQLAATKWVMMREDKYLFWDSSLISARFSSAFSTDVKEQRIPFRILISADESYKNEIKCCQVSSAKTLLFFSGFENLYKRKHPDVRCFEV